MTHTEFVQGLRNAADFFEARPELAAPTSEISFIYYGYYDEAFKHTVDSRSGLAHLVRIIGGKVDKLEDDSYYRVIAKRDGFKIEAVAYRKAICECVKVGTKVEPEHVIPAQPAIEEQVIPEREVEIFEWRCPSLLAPESEEEHPSPHPVGVEA
jgi:hypothetical protein